MEERYIGLSSDSQTRSRFKSENELSCNRPTIHIKPQPVEHIIEEIEVGPSSLASSPLSDIQSEGSPEGEIVPEIILKEDEDLDLDYKDETPNKWSHRNVLLFLETFNQVLNSEEAHGGFLSRKNLFTRVTHMLREKGIHFTQTDTEKKYNNMLMTYRRCQQRLLRLRKTPSWPYFKLFNEIRTRDIRLHNLPTDILAPPRPKRPRMVFSEPPLLPPSFPPLGEEMGGDKSTPQSRGTQAAGDWRKRRLEQDRQKLCLVEDLLRVSEGATERDDATRRKLRDAEEEEAASLEVLRQEIRETKEAVTQSVRTVTLAIQELTKLVATKRVL